MKIAGIDLAWRSDKNTTAVAIGAQRGEVFRLEAVHEAIAGLDAIVELIEHAGEVQGVAIDAPLIVGNRSGHRICDRELSKAYGGRKVSCHACNLRLYPDPAGCGLSRRLQERGYGHLVPPGKGRWQLECYPHPALIEMFGLPERLGYKKGNVDEKKRGQAALATLIKSLQGSRTLRVEIGNQVGHFLYQRKIFANRGVKIKENEDALDAILCAYIGALYASSVFGQTFGSVDVGYIYVPRQKCI